jgi:hypothetical protein
MAGGVAQVVEYKTLITTICHNTFFSNSASVCVVSLHEFSIYGRSYETQEKIELKY